MTSYKSYAYDIAVENADGVKIYYNYINDSKELEVTFENNYPSHNTYYYDIVIPEDVTYMNRTMKVTSIGNDAFRKCPVNSVTISNSVTSIGRSAFYDCNGLTSVTIGNGVVSIGDFAFSGCYNLTSVIIPNSVREIGSSVFQGCRSMTTLIIGNSVTSIGRSAFDGCNGLTSVTIPNSVTSIGEGAFNICSGLISVTIPSSVKSIGSGLFSGCSGLTSILVESGNLNYDSRNDCNAIIESSSNTLIAGCKNTIIPNSVTSIGNNAFTMCNDLTSVTIPNGVTSIGSLAFMYCSGLTSVTIPNSVTSIGKSAFFGCSGLTSVTISNSVTTIGENAFFDCSGLTSVTIPNSVTSIGNGAFQMCSGLTSVTISNSVTSIGESTFQDCSRLTSVTIPNSVTSIGKSAFLGCHWLTSVTIPNSVTSIGESAFSECYSLKSITIPNSVIAIGKESFCDINLTTVISLIDEPFTISYSVFNTNTFNYATLYVPMGTIKKYKATEGWENFTYIKELDSSGGGETPENPSDEEQSGDDGSTKNGTCGETVNYSYDKTTHKLTISGKGAISDYDNGSNKAPWFSYAGDIQKIEIESGITSIGYFAFYKCSSITSLSIPATVGYIGSSAFEDCTSLTSLALNEGLLNVGGSAFEGCTGLQALSIPSTVNSISINAFKNCKGITDVHCYAETVPDTHFDAFDGTPTEKSTLYVPANSVEAYRTSWPWSDFKNIVAIGSTPADDPTNGSCGETVKYSYNKATHTLTVSGKGAIYDYDNGSNKAPWSSYAGEIQKIEIESGITSIGYFAFYKCSGITSLSIPATVGYIGSSAFEGCASLASLSLNEGLLSIGGSAFEGCAGLQTLSIPSTVNSISINAFKNCKGITDVHCYAGIVPDTHSDAFDGTPTEKSTLYVPSNSVDAYRTSWPWSDFKIIVAIGSTPADDPTSGSCGETVNYSYDKATQTLTISGKGAIYDYDNGSNKAPWSSYAGEIQKIEIKSGITSIGYFAFYKCSSIMSLSIPATIGYIGSSAFEDCTGLTSLSLNDGLLYIGGSAFEGCVGLQTLTIPSTVNSISINAFKNCKGITDVYCYAESVPDTDDNAFDSTPTEKSTLHVPAKAVEAYSTSWPWSDFKEIVPIDPNAIMGVKQSDARNVEYYDLIGRRVNQPQKGLYIRNGKKVIVK
jgi:hypothetical protein